LELLFADHLFSFSSAHIESLLGRAALDIIAAGDAPTSIGAFRMVLARPGEYHESSRSRLDPNIDDRRAYLTRWQQLDRHLADRVRSPAVCFGASEAAGLLRAYAPSAWALVEACTVDGATEGKFGELPIVPLDGVDAETTILLGVRPVDQPHLAARLRSRFANVVTWYDLIDDR
jgi:hypothetical protein